MNLDEFVRKLTLYDSPTLDAFESYAQNSPDLLAAIVTRLLLSKDRGDDGALCGMAMVELRRVWGNEHLADWIRSVWPTAPVFVRRKLTYCVAYPDGIAIDTNLALWLFQHPTTAVDERHGIVAGLSVTAELRDCVALLYELIPKIGKHQEPWRHEILDSFIQDVYRSYGPPESGSDTARP